MDTTKVATKTDIKDLRTELKSESKSIRGEILKVEERVENLEEGQKRIEVKLDRIANTLDGFVGKVSTLTEENQVGAYHTKQPRVDVDDHEKRIKRIESSKRAA